MIGVIAANTFREAARDRLWLILVLFGLALLLANQLITPLALGEGPRITVDLGLSALSFFGLLVTVVVGGALVHQEIDKRSIYIVLARPVGRTSYLLGKWLGLCATLLGTAVLLGAALTVTAWQLRGPESVLPVVQAVYLTCLSFCILCSLAIFFSALSTPLLSALYTIGMYVAGWWVLDLREMAEQLGGVTGMALSGVSHVLPNLEIFNARLAVAHVEPVLWAQVAVATLYAFAYSAAVLALGAIAFQAREFK